MLTRVSSLGCTFWHKAMTNMFSVFSVTQLSSSTLKVLWSCLGKRPVEVFSRPKPSSFQPSDLAHSVGLYEGRSFSWSRMRWGVPCPSLRCSPSGTGNDHLLFRWRRAAQNAFIQITRFEVSSLINTWNLHEAILFSRHVWSPVVLYYYYFSLLHPQHKFHSCKLPLQLLSSSW